MIPAVVTATFLSTEGDYLEAIIDVNGQRLHVMDEFGGAQMAAGTPFQAELWPLPSERDDWDAIFRANPGQEKRLLRLDGWRYLALGQVVSVDPVVCDCGLLLVEAAFSSRDERCVGAYVGVTLARLDACLP